MQFSTITVISFAVAGAHAASSGFTKSCLMTLDKFTLKGLTISTQCQGVDGRPTGFTTNLDITNCYNAIDGVVSCGQGGISGCRCSINPNGVGILDCNCPNNSGKASSNSVNLDDCIGNKGGQLVC
ncbi:hypothetical protein PspLS_08462 [Pyricularia sp. CBS 133598]|nr:hypothetical protein PspLS_08462 [Pyricularia sp. CBS 133598]